MTRFADTPIARCIAEIGDNGGYYTPKKILAHLDECMMAFIAGARRIGKTDFFLHLACLLWSREGKKSMWLRNKKVELEGDNFTMAFLADAKAMGWCPEEWTVRADGVHTSQERDSEIIIYFQALSTYSNARGGAYPGVEMLVLDEYMPEDGRYPRGCAKGLLSLTKTVLSGRESARVFCLSNITGCANPYYARYRIYPRDDITVYPDKGIIIERCRGYRCAILEESPWSRVYRAGGYGDYADESEDPNYSLVTWRVPRGAVEDPTVILTDGRYYSLWMHKGLIYVGETRSKISPSRHTIYAADPSELSASAVLLPPSLAKTIKGWLDAGMMRFAEPNALFDVLDIVYSRC